MSLRERIRLDRQAARQQSKETQLLNALGNLWASIIQKEVDMQITDLDDTQILRVLTHQLKQCEETRTQAIQVGRADLAEKAHFEQTVIQRYLPLPLSELEVNHLIQQAMTETGATQLKQLGQVMTWLQPRVQGRTDMAAMTTKVKKLLTAMVNASDLLNH